MVVVRWQYLVLVVVICSGFVFAFIQDERLRPDAPVVNGEKYIVVVIPSYKNAQWYRFNLERLFQQKYTNYFVIYIDDCSPDHTYELVDSYIKAVGQSHRVLLIHNETRKGALYNLYHAIHACPDRAIMVTLDGDDWFRGNDVLQLINRTYDDSNVWLTYGQFEEFPRGSLGICHPMPEHVVQTKSYRTQHWFTSHLRTFYAGLFKKVKKEDMMFDGEFFSVTWDQSFLFPMLEMADGRIKFIDQILYVYNQANPLNDFKQQLRKQLYCERVIRARQKYQPLDVVQAQSFCVT